MSIASILSDLWRGGGGGASEAPPQAEELQKCPGRGGSNAKVCMSWRLIRTTFQFLCGLLSLFKQFAYFYFFINIVINSFVSNGPLAQSVERGANNSKDRDFEAHTDQISLFIWITFSF